MGQQSGARKGQSHIRLVSSGGKKAGSSGSSSKPKPKAAKMDAREFYIPAHEEGSESVPIAFRADKRYRSMVDEFIYSHRIRQYKTPGHLLRHALDRHMRWLDTIEPGVVSGFITDVDLVNEVIREVEGMGELMTMIVKAEQVINQFTSHNLRPLAVKTVYRLRKKAALMSDPVFRGWMMEEIDRRFAKLMKSKPAGDDLTVDLTAVEDGDETEAERQIHELSWNYDDEHEISMGMGTGGDDDEIETD